MKHNTHDFFKLTPRVVVIIPILKLAKKHNYNPNKSAQFIGSIKTSNSFKVLIADKISETSYKVFKDNNISVDKKFNLSEEEIVSIISNYDGVIVRSSTKITKKIYHRAFSCRYFNFFRRYSFIAKIRN